MRSTDVAVVGAGPAGAWAAYNLARSGARVTIFDPTHPREKPCGGGITGRALALVAGAIGELDPPPASICRARFVDSRSGRSAVVPLDPFDDPAGSQLSHAIATDDRRSVGGAPRTAALVVACRANFDEALLAAACRAGATHSAVRVANVAVDGGGARIETAAGMVRAGFLIGADGANSLVRRRLARPFRRDELSIATGYFAHGITSNEIVIELIDDPPGYIWSFPRPTHLAIGICAQADAGLTAPALRARTAAWIRRTRIADGARLEPYCVAHSVARCGKPPADRAGRDTLVCRRRCSRPGRSDHPGGDLVRSRLRGVGRRRRDGGRRGGVRGACAIGSPARARSRGAAQGGVLPAGIDAPAGSCAPSQRRRS